MIEKIRKIIKEMMDNRKNVTSEERKIVIIVLLLTMIPVLINCFYSAYLFQFEKQNILKIIIETIVLNSVVFSVIYALDKDIRDRISNLTLKNVIMFLSYLIVIIIMLVILNLLCVNFIDKIIEFFFKLSGKGLNQLRIEALNQLFVWTIIIFKILKKFFIIFSIGIILFNIIILLNYILLLIILKFIKNL